MSELLKPIFKRQVVGIPMPDAAIVLSRMFANNSGGLYSMAESPMYQNTAKTTPATADGSPVRLMSPIFGSGDITAPSDAARPLLKIVNSVKNLTFDKVDDSITTSLLAAGSIFIATTNGMYYGGVPTATAPRPFGNPTYNPKWPVVGFCVINRAFTGAEIIALNNYFSTRGGSNTFPTDISNFSRQIGINSFGKINLSSGTNFSSAWNGNQLTSFPSIDLSSGTNFSNAWSSNQLTSFPSIDLSSGTNFSSAWYGNQLSSFPYEILQGLICIAFSDTWSDNNLNAQSVDGILTTIRDNANTFNLNNGTLRIRYGTNAAPTNGSVTGMNGIKAKSDLVTRGWTVTTN